MHYCLLDFELQKPSPLHTEHKPVSGVEKETQDVTVVAIQGVPPANSHASLTCALCNQLTHKIYACSIFKNKTQQERY